MKKQLILFVLMMLPLVASADTVKIGDIYYYLKINEKTAEVRRNLLGYYEGEIVIPSTVVYKSVEYNVTSIGEYAFNFCKDMTSVTIPNSVTNIGKYAFESCTGLTSIIIGNNVTSIEDNTFYLCTGLTSIIIPNSVTRIGNNAFRGCTSLTSIIIGNNVTSIGKSAFESCTSITSITIPNSVKKIGDAAFANCEELIGITIGTGIKDIGMGSFARCHELLNVYCYSESIPKTSTSAFYDSYIDYVTLHVPASAIDLYKAASPWDEFKEIVALTDQEMSVDGITGDKKQEVARYAIGGQRIGKDTKGLNIIRMSDGTTKKVVMK